MDEALKRFNLIDFLGIFVPGLLVELCVNYYWIDLLLPARKVIEENAFILGLCFVVFAFLFGSLLHTVGSLLDKLMFALPNRLEKLNEAYLNNESMKYTYKKIFGECVPEPSRGQGWNTFRKINRYLQRETRPERIVVFTAHSNMSRTMVAALLMILILVLCFDSSNYSLLLLCGIGAILFFIRWQHFEKLWIDEICTMFEAL